ncbi:hypothetical protein Purlil1_7936 [Purpureocillium lilacinum]|uniref:BTB domain-containing protein n=2 Tax=Purpureocillium lilacinum TaxID=33203 RepID=A0ABR0BUC6_PURLI|nr:hypothetical protein Purlil1_7936 [Purpureocillium lilacinum]
MASAPANAPGSGGVAVPPTAPIPQIPPIEDIVAAPGGDVVLVVGRERVKIQVLAVVLKNSSRVFAAMFRPEFAEGHALYLNQGSNEPIEIELPEDDPLALGTLCKLVHCTVDAGRYPGSGKKLLGVAKAADKYDLITRLAFPSNQWFCELKRSRDPAQILAGLMAAHILGHKPGFALLSRWLMFCHGGSWGGLMSALPGVDKIAYELIVAVEEARAQINAAMIERINRFTMAACMVPGNCSCPLEKPELVRKWFTMINTKQPTLNVVKLQSLSISELISDIHNLSHLQSAQLTGVRHECGKNLKPLVPDAVPAYLNQKLAAFKGLCILCFDRKKRYDGRDAEHQEFSEGVVVRPGHRRNGNRRWDIMNMADLGTRCLPVYIELYEQMTGANRAVLNAIRSPTMSTAPGGHRSQQSSHCFDELVLQGLAAARTEAPAAPTSYDQRMAK